MSRKKQSRAVGKASLWERVGKHFEIDADMISGGGRVEIRGRSRVDVGGVKKIRSYTDTQVVLVMERGSLSVCGKRLECVLYQRGEAAVEGCIESVCFGE